MPESLLVDMVPDLKKQGREYVGPCPRCGGTDRFSVTPEKDLFFCRGASVGRAGCDWGGDAITFLRDYYGYSFQDACRELDVDPENYDSDEASRAKQAWVKYQRERRWEQGASWRRHVEEARLRQLATPDERLALRKAGRLRRWRRALRLRSRFLSVWGCSRAGDVPLPVFDLYARIKGQCYPPTEDEREAAQARTEAVYDRIFTRLRVEFEDTDRLDFVKDD